MTVLGIFGGRRGAVLGRPGVLLGRLGSFRRPFSASLRASWVRPRPSRDPLGLSGGHLGGLLGYLEAPFGRRGAILEASWAVLSRRKLEKARMRTSFKNSNISASSGLAGGSLGALLGHLGGFLSGLGAILGHHGDILGRLGGIFVHLGGSGGLPGPSWKPSWASWTMWRAPGTCLGADGALGRGGDKHSEALVEGGFRRLQQSYQTALGIVARLIVPGGTVADNHNQKHNHNHADLFSSVS